MKIGIIYIATGAYIGFWNEFYPSCEHFFCVDAEKGYEVFTDSDESVFTAFPNAHVHCIEDRGWIINTSFKSKFICDIHNHLGKYDYVFFINSNFKFVAPSYCNEILPDACDDYLTALSFDHYLDVAIDQYPYDRNEQCHAYIPYGQGQRYFQGGFYGGRTREVIALSEWCREAINKDLGNKIIARFHDESYINRYLLALHPKILNDKYALQDIWPYEGEYKAIILNKAQYLGAGTLAKSKKNYADVSLAFLLNEHIRFVPWGIVNLYGGLGNQMFGYAFYLYICHILTGERKWWIDASACKRAENHNGYELSKVFGKVNDSLLLSLAMRQDIHKAGKEKTDSIEEKHASVPQVFAESEMPVSVYAGCWQCTSYVEACAEEIKKTFHFKEKVLNEASAILLREIKSSNSVSVHIRRGDYLKGNNEFMYGGICTVSYYKQAMELMGKLLPDPPLFVFFTDDPEWVRTTFNLDNACLADWNHKSESWQDMCLMAACKHHIIANSSFSWWGAWLGGYPDKKVIAPETWLNTMDTPDILPQEWIRIATEPDREILRRICNHLLLNSSYLNLLGLQNGKMGSVVFFFHYAGYTQNSLYESYAEELFDEVYEEITKETPYSFANGLCGIGWAIEYLVHQGFIEGNTDDALADIDQRVMLYDPLRLANYTLANGLEGIICYALSRLLSPRNAESPLPFDERYLESLHQAARQMSDENKTKNIQLFLEYMQGKSIKYPFKDVMKQLLSLTEKAFDTEGLTWQTGLKMMMRQ